MPTIKLRPKFWNKRREQSRQTNQRAKTGRGPDFPGVGRKYQEESLPFYKG